MRYESGSCAVCNKKIRSGTLCNPCEGKNLNNIFINYYYSDKTLKGLLTHIKHYYVQEALDILIKITCDALEKAAAHQPALRISMEDPEQVTLVPVPLHKNRLRERGFNQSQLLAEGLARYFGWTVNGCLKKIKNTAAQTLLPRRKRLENVKDAFVLEKDHDLTGRHVIIVDDVVTTGSTLTACAAVLETAKPISISAIVVAKNHDSSSKK